MCYVSPTPKIKELQEKVYSYRARSKKEDRGDHYIVGTPDYILEYAKEVDDFFRRATTGPNGEKLM